MNLNDRMHEFKERSVAQQRQNSKKNVISDKETQTKVLLFMLSEFIGVVIYENHFALCVPKGTH